MSVPPRYPRKRPIQLDWVVVSIEGARRLGRLLLFLLLAGGVVGGVVYLLHEPVEKRAQRTLQQTVALREEVRRGGISDALRSEFEQASRLLDDASADCARKDFPACLARAQDAQRRFNLLLGLVNPEFSGSGQIIAVQGKVEVQRANRSEWERAHERQWLYNGDFVKTSSGASAEIIFADGTVFRIGPDSLLEVHREAQGGREPRRGEVKLEVGQVNVHTVSNPSLVLTDAVQAEVQTDSHVGVDVDRDSSATVAAYGGTARVTGASGQHVELATRQAVRAEASGRLGPQLTVPQAPILRSPPANFLLELDRGNRITLSWDPVAGAARYDLEVSRSRIFSPSGLEVEAKERPSTSATLNVLRPGTYYWRVAALGEGRIRSEWSSPRAFKAFAGRRVEEIADTTPPRLEVERPKQMGNFVLIQGMTEPGSTVTVNGEPVAVAGDGSFKKAVVVHREGKNELVIRATDPAGNTAERIETVFVEVD